MLTICALFAWMRYYITCCSTLDLGGIYRRRDTFLCTTLFLDVSSMSFLQHPSWLQQRQPVYLCTHNHQQLKQLGPTAISQQRSGCATSQRQRGPPAPWRLQVLLGTRHMQTRVCLPLCPHTENRQTKIPAPCHGAIHRPAARGPVLDGAGSGQDEWKRNGWLFFSGSSFLVSH